MTVNDLGGQRITEVVQSLKEYDPERVRAAVENALKAGITPVSILEKGLSVGIKEVGVEFAKGRIFLPELVLASKAMQEGVEALRSQWKNMESERKILGKVAMGTVKGDMHNIGKGILGSLMSASGFEFFDLGEDVSDETFIDKVRTIKPHILGLSALLTTSMPHQGYVIKALEKAGLRGKVVVMVGGAPTTKEWAQKIGADGWAPNAALAVEEAKKLLGVKS